MIEGWGGSDCPLTLTRKENKMKNMNRISKHLLTLVIAIVIIAGCIYAGRTEYNDVVLSGMSAEKYQYIHDHLKGRASQEDVVKEYITNQKYYDSKQY